MVVIKIFNATDTNFNTAGNIIIEPLYCKETKKKSLNGWYIDVEIPVKYKQYIEQDKLCVVKTKSKLNPQAFRIKDIEYTLNKIVFKAYHVIFDAEDYFLLDVRPTNMNGLNALNYINDRTDKISPFSMLSNVENTGTAYFIRKSLLEAWTIIEERWQGSFDADNWNISFLSSVGSDKGETIRYGNNLQEMTVTEDWSGVCTKLYPVGQDELMLPEKYLESQIQYDEPYTRTIKFDTKLDEEQQTTDNLITELRTNATNYLNENSVPKVCYEINSNINQEMEIGDIIAVKHPLCDISTEVLEYEYDLLTKKITKLVFGNYTKNVKKKFQAITDSIEAIREAVSKQEVVINNQTNIINSLNKNGYVYIDDNEILILDSLPKESAHNVWRFGLGGIGFSSNGYEGPFEVAMTMDGQINANFITTGTLSVSRIEGLANFISETSSQLAQIEVNADNIAALVDTTEQIEREFETLQDVNGQSEGKYIYLDDASDELITSAKFNGETSQETRSGKNLLGLTNGTYTNRGITAVVTNGIITLSGTSNDSSYASIIDIPLINPISSSVGTVIKSLNPTGTYTGVQTSLRASNADTSVGLWSNNAANQSGTLSGNAYYLRIQINYNVTVNCTLKAQVESGTTATDFEKYGVMPSPDYPSEIENIKGKNLLKSIDSSQTINGITFTLNEDKSITINGTATANALITVYGEWNGTTIYQKLNPDKYYTISGSTNSNIQIFTRITNGSTISSHTPQTNPTFTGQTGIVNYFIQVLSGAVCDNITIKPQLEEGSKATSYVPYNSLEVKVVNKNIFDEIIELGSINPANGSLSDSSTRTRSKNYTKVEPNTTYSITRQAGDNRWVVGYTKNKIGITDGGAGGQASALLVFASGFLSGTFTTSATTEYIKWYDTSLTNTSEKVIINKGSTPISYEEHQEQTVYFPLAEGQKLYEGSYLADDGIHNVRTQIVFDGSSDEDWKIWALSGNNVERFYINITNSAMNKEFKSSHFIMSSLSDNGDYEHSRGATSSGQYIQWICFISKSKATTVAELKTWLSSNPVTLEYTLNQEEIIPYNTDQQAAWNSIKSLHTYKTVTHIYSDAYAEIGYIKDNMLSAFETKASAQLTKNDVSQLKIENGRISSEVSSTQSQLNNYYTKKEVDNNTNSTKAELQNIIQQNKTEVEQTTQALNLRVSSIETNGVDKIETSMGYTFNNEGLNIDKEGAATASTIDNEAFKVKNKSANENVFFAGYVSDQNSAYRGQTIVESTNLVVKNYLNIEGASRFQPYVNPVLGGHGTGAFDIG